MIKEIKGVTLDPVEVMVKNSFKNFHAKGLSYLCLQRSDKLTQKIYLFDGDVSKLPEVINPHDHRYGFKTTVLAGLLQNSTYVPTPRGTCYNQFEWRTPLNGGNGFTWKGERRLRLLRQESIPQGKQYTMKHQGIHTIRTLQDQTVLLLEQYEDDLPLETPTSTYALGKEPPSLDGLYEKFKEQELLDLLPKIAEL